MQPGGQRGGLTGEPRPEQQCQAGSGDTGAKRVWHGSHREGHGTWRAHAHFSGMSLSQQVAACTQVPLSPESPPRPCCGRLLLRDSCPPHTHTVSLVCGSQGAVLGLKCSCFKLTSEEPILPDHILSHGCRILSHHRQSRVKGQCPPPWTLEGHPSLHQTSEKQKLHMRHRVCGPGLCRHQLSTGAHQVIPKGQDGGTSVDHNGRLLRNCPHQALGRPRGVSAAELRLTSVQCPALRTRRTTETALLHAAGPHLGVPESGLTGMY